MTSEAFILMEKIGRVIDAIDSQVDWFVYQIQESDPDLRAFYDAMYKKRCRELEELLEEIQNGND